MGMVINRFEIYLVNLDPVRGQDGDDGTGEVQGQSIHKYRRV